MTSALFDMSAGCARCGRPETGGSCPWCVQADPALAGQLASLTAVPASWYDAALEWLEGLERGRVFTSETLTNAVGKPSATRMNANNAVGAFMNGQARLGRITGRGYVKSRNKESHGAVIREWVRS